MTTPLAFEEYLQYRFPDDAQISPDGQHVAFVMAELVKEAADKPARSQVWLASATGGAPARPITFGPSQDRSPRWAPDGSRLAFLSDREKPGKGHQIYLLPMTGGEAVPLTHEKGSVAEFAWCQGGRLIAFLMSDPDPEGQGDVIQFEDRPQFQRLYVVDVESGKVAPVSPEGVQVWEFTESPDGARFALIASALPWEWSWYQSYVATVPAAGGPVTRVFGSNRQVGRPCWSPDGRQIAFLSSSWSDRGSCAGDLFVVDANGGEARHVSAGYEGSLTWFEWKEPEYVLFNGYEGMLATVGRYHLDGRRDLLWKDEAAFGPRFWPKFSLAGARLAAVREDFRTLPQIYTADVAATSLTWHRSTELNAAATAMERGEARLVRWKAPDGLEIEGALLTPSGYTGAERLPLVVIVHGGPTSLYSSRTNWNWAPFLATRGVAVLLPNPRGSTGRGLAFAEANLGDMGGGDLQDILAGVDHCVALGVADPDRLGIAGWSYGGYMAAWATTQTDRFKAAVVGAAIINWVSFHGTSEIPTWDAAYLKDHPYGGAEYVKWAPITHVAKVKTPSLILHGEKDTCVPVGQGYEWFRALREHGVECHLRVYPREPHGLKEKAHVLDMQESAVNWLIAHLG